MAESLKMKKNAFRPRPKSKKQQKSISATAETEKTVKNGFLTIGKQQDWRLNQIHVYYY